MMQVDYPRPQRKKGRPISEVARRFWTFAIPAFSGWTLAVYLYLITILGPEHLTIDRAIESAFMLPVFVPLSVIGVPGVLLFLVGCYAYAASMNTPLLRRVSPLSSVALGILVILILEISFPRGHKIPLGADHLNPWPFWMVQYPSAVTTAFSAWVASALLHKEKREDDRFIDEASVQPIEPKAEEKNDEVIHH